ncbi:MAG: DedA family protein [Actinomycetota bacterium]
METTERNRWILIGLGAIRALLYIVAIPLVPLLYADHFLVLVVLRPSKEVLVAAGFAARQGEIGLFELVVAALPLSVLGVWLFFFLGRAYAADIRNNRLSGLAGRLLRPQKINEASKILRRKGDRLIVLGRLAFLASTPVAVAAGVLHMRTTRFLRADASGAVVSLVLSVAAGYALGEAYERAGPWLTGVGVLALISFAILLGRYLTKQ